MSLKHIGWDFTFFTFIQIFKNAFYGRISNIFKMVITYRYIHLGYDLLSSTLMSQCVLYDPMILVTNSIILIFLTDIMNISN